MSVRIALPAWGVSPNAVEVARYFGRASDAALATDLPAFQVAVETERSFIWHPAGLTPAPLRWFPGRPHILMAAVKSE